MRVVSGPRQGPVPKAALRDLLQAVQDSVPVALVPLPERLIAWEAACAEARHFKVDVSFSLGVDGQSRARLSVNDKGEAVAFRERVLEQREALQLPADVRAFFALVPPGELKTTLGVKWGADGGRPERVSLYFEELYRTPRYAEVTDAVFALAGLGSPPVADPLVPISACIDWVDGQMSAVKDYYLETWQEGEEEFPLPPVQDAFRRSLGLHARKGTRRCLVARRFSVSGGLVGHKVLWMTEAHHIDRVAAAWAQVDRLRASLGIPDSSTSVAMDTLRATWRHGPETFLYPDLVSLDVDVDEQVRGLTVYVSVK